MAKVSVNSISDVLHEDWSNDERTGLPYAGKAVREGIQKQFISIDEEKLGAILFDTLNMKMLSFKSIEDRDEYQLTESASLVVDSQDVVFHGLQKKITIVNNMGSNNLYFTSNSDTANITLSFTSAEKEMTASEWTEVVEDALFSVAIDKGATGAFETVADNIFVQSGGTFTFDVMRYLSMGANRVKITAIGTSSGQSGNLALSVNLTTMYLAASNFAWYEPFIEGNTYNLGGMNIGGTLQKTLYVKVTNEQGYARTYEQYLGTNIYTTNSYYYRGLEFPTGGTGIYNVDIWVAAGALETDHLNYNIMCVAADDVATAQLCCISDVASAAVNYSDNTLFYFATYNCGSTTSNPRIKLVSIINTNPTTLKDEDMANVPTAEAVAYQYNLEIETEELDVKLDTELTYGVSQKVVYNVDNSASYPATSGAVFYLNAANRNNTQENKLSVINEVTKGSVAAEWTNMAWVDGTDGWTTDENDRKCLVLPALTRCDIAYQPLAKVGSGKTIELTYKVRNASSLDDTLISICNKATRNVVIDSYWSDNILPALSAGYRNNSGSYTSSGYSAEIELENGVEYSLQNKDWQQSRIFIKNGDTYTLYTSKNSSQWDFTCPDDDATYVLSAVANSESSSIQLLKNVLITEPEEYIPSDFRGIHIKPNDIIVHSRDLNSDDNGQGYKPKDEEIVNVQVTITRNYKTSYGNLCKIFVNGVVKREFEFQNDDDFAASYDIILGSDTADLYVYAIRVYDTAFGSMDAMKNYVASLPNSKTKKAAGDFIDSVIDDSNAINYDNAVKNANVATIEMLNGAELPHYGLAKSYSAFCNLEVKWYEHPEWNFTATNIQDSGQGTTSMNYWEWNQRQRGDKSPNMVVTYADGTTDTSGYIKFMGDTYPACQRLTAKKNYASSMQSHKMGATAAFNDLHHALGLDNEVGGRVAVYQEPFYFFLKTKIEGSDQYAYSFMGLYTYGADKGDKPTFGYDNSTYKSTLIHMEGTDHQIKGVGMDYPWSGLAITENDGDFFVSVDKGSNSYDNAWEIGAAGGKKTTADVKTLIEAEFKPAYEVAYNNSTMILGVTETLDEMNADVDAFGLQKDADGHAYQRYEVFTDGVYDLYYLNKQSGKYEATGVNLLTDCGLSTSDLSGKTLAEKTEAFREVRRTRFKANASNYWHIDDTLFNACFLELKGASDNFKKNSYPYKFALLEDGGRWRWRNDDLDTLFDLDNQGKPEKDYAIEAKDFADDSKTAYVFKGEDSVFWTLIYECYADEMKVMGRKILEAMAELSTSGSTTIDRLMGFYETYFWSKAQNYFAKSAYNADAESSYEDAWPNYTSGKYSVDVHPLDQSLGDHLEAEQNWVYKRLIYMMSKWGYGPFQSYTDACLGRITFRTQLAQGFDITPFMDLYPTILSGQGAAHAGGRTDAGDSVRISGVGGTNTNVYIMAADVLESIGDLSTLAVDATSDATLGVASKRLKTLKVGDETATNVTSNLSTLNVGQCDSLVSVDARNLASLTGTVNLSQCPRLQEALFGGTDVRSLVLANGSKVTHVQLSSNTTSLTLRNLTKLTNLEYDDISKVEFFRVENCTNLNPFEMLKEIYNAEGNNLNGIRVTGFSFSGDASDVQFLAAIATDIDKDGNEHDYRGIDANGVVQDILPVIEGYISIDGSVYESDYNAIQQYFPQAVIAFSGGFYVRFNDETIQQIAVDTWGDGVGVTKDTLAAVTTLDSKLINSGVTTFTDLDKFTGLTTLDKSFEGMTSLTSFECSNVDLSHLSTSWYGWNQYDFLYNCSNLTSLKMTNWTIAEDVCTNAWFNGLDSLTELDLSGWTILGSGRLRNGVGYGNGFISSKTITKIILPTSLKKYHHGGDSTNSSFIKCPNLTELVVNSDLIYSGSACGLLRDCQSLTNLDAIANWDVSGVTSLNAAFYNCTGLTSFNLPNWDVSAVTSFSSTFCDCSKLQTIDLSSWDNSVATTTNSMFQGCSSLTSVNLSALNTQNVTRMDYMFGGCSSLTTLDLRSFDFTKVTNIDYIFYGCDKLQSVQVSDSFYSNLNHITTLRGYWVFYIFSMDNGLLTIPTLSSNTSVNYFVRNNSEVTKVVVEGGTFTYMENAFRDCSNLEEIDLSACTISNAHSAGAFYGCAKCTKISVGTWSIKKTFNSDSHFKMTGVTDLIATFDIDTTSVSFSVSPLNRASALRIFDGLATYTDGSTHTLSLSSTTKGYLSDDDIAIATNKGWTIA